MSGDDPRLADFLDHMLEAIRRVRLYTQNLTVDEFSQNTLVQDGVIRNIEIIGEAARHIERSHADGMRKFPGPSSMQCATAWRTAISQLIWRSSGAPFTTIFPILKSA